MLVRIKLYNKKKSAKKSLLGKDFRTLKESLPLLEKILDNQIDINYCNSLYLEGEEHSTLWCDSSQ